MLYKCANAACVNLFRSMNQGKLFQIQVAIEPAPQPCAMTMRRRRVSPRLEHYWLCDRCCRLFTLTFARKLGLITVPLPAALNKKPPSRSMGEVIGSSQEPRPKVALRLEGNVCPTS
jgi:hypothetical protein